MPTPQHKAPLVLPCPACRTAVAWREDNPYRPFCSRRCKDGDFLRWARDEQRIAGDNAAPWPDDHAGD